MDNYSDQLTRTCLKIVAALAGCICVIWAVVIPVVAVNQVAVAVELTRAAWPTDTPTLTPTVTPTFTPTPTGTPIPTWTPEPTLSPTPTGTFTPSPTATSTGTPVPTWTPEAQTLSPTHYGFEVKVQTDRMANALESLGLLLGQPITDGEAWAVSVATQAAEVKLAHRELSSIVPPPEFASHHIALLDATGDCDEFVDSMMSSLVSENPDDASRAVDLIHSCGQKFRALTATLAPTATPFPTSPPPAVQPSGGGATALCNDGTLSYSQSRSGTCSHHGGVAIWY